MSLHFQLSSPIIDLPRIGKTEVWICHRRSVIELRKPIRIDVATLTCVGILTESNSPKETRFLGVEWIGALAQKVIRKTKSLSGRISACQWIARV